MSTAKHSKRPDKQHLIGMGCMAVAAILFPVKDSFINAQDERVTILLAIAIYSTFQSLIAICILVGLRGQRIRNPYTGLSVVALARSAALFGLYIVLTRRLPRYHHPVELFFQDGVFAGIAFSAVDGERLCSQPAQPCDDRHRASNCRTDWYNLVADDDWCRPSDARRQTGSGQLSRNCQCQMHRRVRLCRDAGTGYNPRGAYRCWRPSGKCDDIPAQPRIKNPRI